MTKEELIKQMRNMKEVIELLLMYINNYDVERYLYYLCNSEKYEQMIEYLTKKSD